MTDHAVLSPSSAERWLTCGASIRVIAEMTHEPEESVYATEGTMAHELGYLKAALKFGEMSRRTYNRRLKEWKAGTPEDYHDDMDRYTDLYVELLDRLMEEHGATVVMLEKTLPTGIDECYGTGDAILIAPKQKHVHVVDLKYGKGVSVSAVENPQLMLYGLGALDTFALVSDFDTVGMTVFQPRLGNTSTYTMAAHDLRVWRDEVVAPAAALALSQDAPFVPSAEACRFCPVAGECKPRMDHVLAMDFGSPDLMTPEELADSYRRLDEIRDWCNALELTALSKAYSEGVHLPGYKVVLSGGRRSIADVDQAVKVLTAAGYNVEQVARLGIKPLGELEKLVGRKELPELLGDLMVRSKGKPSLVDLDDPRPELNPEVAAARDFQ